MTCPDPPQLADSAAELQGGCRAAHHLRLLAMIALAGGVLAAGSLALGVLSPDRAIAGSELAMLTDTAPAP